MFDEIVYYHALLEGPLNANHLNPYNHWRRYNAWKKLNIWLHAQIRSHFERLKSKNKSDDKAPDIIDLAVEEFGTALSMEEYAEDAKLFLFAGHDTTSAMLSWFYYTLSQLPDVVQKMREEHDQVFGPDRHDTQGIYKQILEKPTKLLELKYTTQCLKETLRMYPPAGGSGRMSHDPKY
jgi:cytochrome P450